VLNELATADARISVFHTDNHGVELARNLAISKSSGEYIFILDADDSIRPRFIPLAVEILLAHPEVVFVHSDVQFTGQKDRIAMGEDFDIHRFLISNYYVNCGLFRRSAFDATPHGYETKAYLNTHEDWFLLMQLLLNGGKFYRIPEVLTIYYSKPDSKLQNVSRDKGLLARVYNYAFPLQLKLLRYFTANGSISKDESSLILGEIEHKLAYFNLNFGDFFWGFSLAFSSISHKPSLWLKNFRIIFSSSIKRLMGLFS
jgi:glycosyltransferase involved in cell wall biosynthesis